jgi:hypothetical protein
MEEDHEEDDGDDEEVECSDKEKKKKYPLAKLLYGTEMAKVASEIITGDEDDTEGYRISKSENKRYFYLTLFLMYESRKCTKKN